MRASRLSVFFVVFGLLAACDTLTSAPAPAELEVATTSTPAPIVKDGNPTCKDLLGSDYLELKVDPGASGTYSNGYLQVTITVTNTPAGPTFSFTTNRTVDAVIAKGGQNGANLYDYRPNGTQSGTGLHSPANNNGEYAGLSHISFCYQLRLDVTKTAATTVKRIWTWDIAKTADATALTLQQGQFYLVNYGVKVSATSKDNERTVLGTITATNNTGAGATVTGVSDLLGSTEVAPNCGVAFPYTLAAGESLNCSYSHTEDDTTILPDTGINTAMVTTSGQVKGGTATAPWDFAHYTLSAEIDECVTVTDTLRGDLGTVCAKDLTGGSKTFNYALEMKDYALECGETIITNTAKLNTNDTEAVDESSHTVTVTINCVTGCTLTQGYWKTHSKYGPAPYDDTWKVLGEDTAFFKSGKTYYQVLWTAPRGDPYYVLAHQYIAATLNALANADVSAVKSDLEKATAYFSGTIKLGKADILALAARLDAYNNGLSGPGHCSEK